MINNKQQKQRKTNKNRLTTLNWISPSVVPPGEIQPSPLTLCCWLVFSQIRFLIFCWSHKHKQTHTHSHTNTYKHTQAHTSTHPHTHTSRHKHTPTHTNKHKHTHTHSLSFAAKQTIHTNKHTSKNIKTHKQKHKCTLTYRHKCTHKPQEKDILQQYRERKQYLKSYWKNIQLFELKSDIQADKNKRTKQNKQFERKAEREHTIKLYRISKKHVSPKIRLNIKKYNQRKTN